MIPFVLPNILLIAEGLTADEYLNHILPSLLPVFQMEEPVQVGVVASCLGDGGGWGRR